jgi:putative oxidoreductase
MTDQDAIDFALLLFRCGIGAVMLAHGINHIFGGGKIKGTAAWFGSIGMRPPLVQAWMASLTEIGAGVLLISGLLMPFGGAGTVGVMAVAFVVNHRGNGFFIFRPGEGWEYVMVLLICGITLGTIGGGRWSLDNAFGIDDNLRGVSGLLISAIAGLGGAALLLAVAWRPVRRPAEAS